MRRLTFYRIYFLLPDVETTRKVVRDLLLNQVEEKNINIVAREGTPLEELPEAGTLQTSDLIPAAQKGLTLGGMTGALAGLVAVTIPPAGLVLGGGAVLAMTAAGAGAGAWISSMLGAGFSSSRLEKFQEAIEAGEILRACSQSPEQQCQERHIDELQAGIELTLAVLP